MIIGICGFIGSGKDTVASILQKEHGFQRLAFADTLKDAVSVMFGWGRCFLEGDTEESRKFRETPDEWWSKKLGYEVTPRHILQKFGTEACRNGLDENIWVHCLSRRAEHYNNVVIPDVRFRNEIDYIKNAGGFILRVDRGLGPSKAELSKMHISETAWTQNVPNYVIENNGTLDELSAKVNLILTIEGKSTTMVQHPE